MRIPKDFPLCVLYTAHKPPKLRKLLLSSNNCRATASFLAWQGGEQVLSRGEWLYPRRHRSSQPVDPAVVLDEGVGGSSGGRGLQVSRLFLFSQLSNIVFRDVAAQRGPADRSSWPPCGRQKKKGSFVVWEVDVNIKERELGESTAQGRRKAVSTIIATQSLDSISTVLSSATNMQTSAKAKMMVIDPSWQLCCLRSSRGQSVWAEANSLASICRLLLLAKKNIVLCPQKLL